MIHPQVDDDSKQQQDHDFNDTQDSDIVKKQYFGYSSSIIIFVSLIFGAYLSASVIHSVPTSKYILTLPERISFIFLSISLLTSAYFFILIILKKDYLKGNPPSTFKMWPVLFGSFVRYTGNVINTIASKQFFGIIGMFVVEFLVCGTVYVVYFVEDDSDSCCLCFKPWVHEKVPSSFDEEEHDDV